MVRTFVWLCVLAWASTAAAQSPMPPPPPPPDSGVQDAAAIGTGAISGVVTDGVSGVPVAGAFVQLTSITPSGTPGPGRSRQMTDAKGRFIFVRLPAGSYTTTATAPGYLDGGYRRTPGMTTGGRIPLADGQWFTESDFPMWKTASLAGTIRDERGEPLVGLSVRLIVGATIGGRAQWVAGPATYTDDRGAYRFGGLHAGRYLVQVPSVHMTLPSGEVSMYRAPQRTTTAGAPASPPSLPPLRFIRSQDGTGVNMGAAPTDGRGSVYPATFYPSAGALSQAEPVALDFGQARSGIDVSLAPVPSVRVSGRVVGRAEDIVDLPVRLMLPGNDALGLGGETGLTKTNARGEFTFAQVPAGEYVVVASRSVTSYRTQGTQAQGLPPGANPFVSRMSNAQVAGNPGLFLNSAGAQGTEVTGEMTVSVGDRAIDDLVIPTVASITVSGYFLWDGAETPPADLTIIPTTRIEPADGNVARGVHFGGPRSLSEPRPARADFTIPNVRPGRYALSDVLSASGHRMVGASHRDRNILEVPLEVTGEAPVTDVVIHMSSQRNMLQGTVRTADGRLADDGIVLVFPPDAAAAAGVSGIRFRTAIVSSTGTFELANLLPGEYLIAAVPSTERHRSADRTFLAAIAGRATRITMSLSGTVSQDLRRLEGQR